MSSWGTVSFSRTIKFLGDGVFERICTVYFPVGSNRLRFVLVLESQSVNLCDRFSFCFAPMLRSVTKWASFRFLSGVSYAHLLRNFWSRGQLKRDGTRAQTRFRLSTKRTSPFKSAGGRQFSRLLAAEVCASAVVMLDTPCSGVVWRVLATHFIRQFPLHFPSRASPCAITFQLESVILSVLIDAQMLPPTLANPLKFIRLYFRLSFSQSLEAWTSCKKYRKWKCCLACTHTACYLRSLIG